MNIGPNTAPQTFAFARNCWYSVDQPAKSAPRQLTAEKDALVGRDPLFTDPSRRDFSLRSDSPAAGKGHTGLKDKR